MLMQLKISYETILCYGMFFIPLYFKQQNELIDLAKEYTACVIEVIKLVQDAAKNTVLIN